MKNNINKTYTIGGVDIVALAKKVGTPIQIYDQELIEKTLATFKESFKSDVFTTDVLYASKAFQCHEMMKLVEKYGFCIDVVSGGEMYCAKSAGFPMERALFHGNNKSEAEIRQAFDYKVGMIMIDNVLEMELLCEIANELKQPMNVLIRVNPGLAASTHEYIMTGQLDSKFGINIQDREAFVKLLKPVLDHKYLIFKGLHAHIGSQIFDSKAFEKEAVILSEFIAYLEKEHGIMIERLDLGGGFAAKYTDEDDPLPISKICKALIKKCESEKERLGISLSHLYIEPGRSIIAEAGYTLYSVGFQKQAADKHYVFVDGGMSDNIRPALYGAKYSCDIITKMDAPKTVNTTVAGKNCESGDILIKNIMLPEVERGDLLLMHTTGAYGHSMASNYNKLPRPGAVFVKDGKARLVLRTEAFEDLNNMECDEDISL